MCVFFKGVCFFKRELFVIWLLNKEDFVDDVIRVNLWFI